MNNLKQRISAALALFKKQSSHADILLSTEEIFTAGFYAGIEDTATKVIQSNDDVIREIDEIVGRIWARANAEKLAKTAD